MANTRWVLDGRAATCRVEYAGTDVAAANPFAAVSDAACVDGALTEGVDDPARFEPPRLEGRGRRPQVRLLMPLCDADDLAEELGGVDADDRANALFDQLWLRSVLIEQWRRTNLAERSRFERRADRLLAALDPEAPALNRTAR